ncbi:DUF6233 domain-containing protein [Streptomyces violaceus]
MTQRRRPNRSLDSMPLRAIRTPMRLPRNHAGDCHAAGNRRRPIDRDEARRLLPSGLPACPHCQPDIELRILD